MLRFFLYLVRSLLVVCWRRLRVGPARPQRPLPLEVLVQALRAHLRWAAALPVPKLRKELSQLRGLMAAGVDVETKRIAGVNVLWFKPETCRPGRLVLYAHGGGRVAGSAEQDRALTSRLARLLAAPVAAVDYRLAPEAVAPADRDDFIDVYRAVRGHYDDIVFVGLSAGGATVLAALVELRAQNELPSRAVLLSPLVDATVSRPSWFDNVETDYGIREVIAAWSRTYAGALSLSDPLVSPLNASLNGLAPLLVVAGQAELLRDDAAELAARAEAAGVDVTLLIEAGQPHAFMALGLDNAASIAAFEAIKTFVGS